MRCARLALPIGLVLLVACSGAPAESTGTTTTTARTDEAVAAWTEDMDAFAAGLRHIHPNPFWRASEAEFDAALAAAPARLATMTPTQAKVEVMRLASVIDGHSGVYPAQAGFHLYALHLYLFADGLHVVNADDPSLVGARVLDVAGTPADAVLALVRPLAAHDNDETIDVVVPMLVMTPEVLDAVGVVPAGSPADFHLLTQDGREVTVDPMVLDWATFPAHFNSSPVGLPQRAEPLTLTRRDEPFWWTTVDGPAGPALYFEYNQVVSTSGATSLRQVVDELRAALDSGAANRLVIDLRHNPGGDNHTYAPLLDFLETDPRFEQPGGLYVLIGRQTFSAAMNFATEVDGLTAATFVGEPTGGRPNLYGDVRPVRLPNSGIVVEVSSRYWGFGGPDDTRPWIEPEIPIALSSDDLLAGRDPVLDAALA